MPKPRVASAQDRAKQDNLPRAQRRALARELGEDFEPVPHFDTRRVGLTRAQRRARPEAPAPASNGRANRSDNAPGAVNSREARRRIRLARRASIIAR